MNLQEILEWYNLIFYVSIILGISFIFASIIAGTGDSDHDGHIDNDHDGFSVKILSFFGVGKCPISLMLFSWFLVFGGTGLILTHILGAKLVAISIILSFVISLVLTNLVATTFSKFFPNLETYAIRPHDLVGSTGKVVISVTKEFGKIHVLDQYGGLHKVDARSYEGSYPIGTQVLVVEFKDNVFYVDISPQEIQ